MISEGFEGRDNLDRIPHYLLECAADGVNDYFEKSLGSMGFSKGFEVKEIIEDGPSMKIIVKTPLGKELLYTVEVKRAEQNIKQETTKND